MHSKPWSWVIVPILMTPHHELPTGPQAIQVRENVMPEMNRLKGYYLGIGEATVMMNRRRL
jgi:hypothetical protein